MHTLGSLCILWFETLAQDLRYTFRQLIKTLGYTLTATLTLALGVGANSAVFTVINDAMLRSLPVQRPAKLSGYFDIFETGGDCERHTHSAIAPNDDNE